MTSGALKRCALSVLFTALALPAWAVNKCTAPDGRVSFQDAPCDGDKRLDPPTPPTQARIYQPKAPRPPIGDEEYERKRALERSKEIDAYAKAAGRSYAAAAQESAAKCGNASREPHVGASAHWIRQCSTWGDPDQVHSTVTAFGESQQWVYRRRGYLYFDGKGLVTTIQK